MSAVQSRAIALGGAGLAFACSRPSSSPLGQPWLAKMTNRLMWLSDEAHGYGWTLLARHRDARITYVLADERGETEFDTLDEVEQEMRSMCRIRKLPPMRDL